MAKNSFIRNQPGLGLHPLNQLNEMADREKSLNVTGHFGGELKKITGDTFHGMDCLFIELVIR